MRESMKTVEVMEARLAEHEHAVEAAMAAIRHHSEKIEGLESHIQIVREALSTAIEQAEDTPEYEATETTQARRAPVRPILRPVPPPPPQPPQYKVG